MSAFEPYAKPPTTYQSIRDHKQSVQTLAETQENSLTKVLTNLLTLQGQIDMLEDIIVAKKDD